jgi:ATP-dependent Zn protease
VLEIVGSAEERALGVLRDRAKTLEALAQALLDRESLDREEIADLLEKG